MSIQKIDIQTRRQIIEAFAAQHMQDGDVAHDYKHADRVRNNALKIAKMENYLHVHQLEAAALLHDIGLKYVENRSIHGEKGAQMAKSFLSEQELFAPDDIEDITLAIRLHNSLKPHDSSLLAILRDADMLELFGAIGIMRAYTSKAHLPEYFADNPMGETWGMNADDFSQRFADGTGIGKTIVDHLNFEISCFENLNTQSARELARPLIDYMQAFLQQLQTEIENS